MAQGPVTRVAHERKAKTSERTSPTDFDWNSAIRNYDRRVFLSLLALGLGPEQARELKQKTWTRLLEKYAEGALTEIHLPGLAIRQARFLGLDALKRGGKATGKEDKTLEAIPDPGASPEIKALTKQQLGRAQAALLGCSPSSQRVFRMVYENPGMAHRAVAQQVGLSVQRVRQILCEVRKAVRQAIDEEDV